MIDDLLRRCAEKKASDLHLTCGSRPRLRLQGALQYSGDVSIDPAEVELWLEANLTATQLDSLIEDRALDFGLTHETAGRFRVNAFFQSGAIALSIRRLSGEILDAKELGLPEFVEDLSGLSKGLVIITGPTGSGKTTSLAAIIQKINEERRCHILTIEDPIEFRFESSNSLVHQREVHSDTLDFASAVRSAMREDPDVILVGEMRDLETMRAALMAAETGHLVFTTLHTPDAVGVLDRLVGAFPGSEQDSVRHQLSMILKAVVAQQLVPCKIGGRVPIVEILVVNTAVSHLIRTGKSQQLTSILESGREEGMQTVDYALAQSVTAGQIDIADAERL